jgi:8-oxo-dGTP pyrophosphatase MutT (NUDIX family)
MIAAAMDADAFLSRALNKLRPEPPGPLEPHSNPNGDHALEAGTPRMLTAPPKPAAVLVPVVMHEDEPTMLLTQRASHMRNHSGQIALPGGRIDEGETPLATALREAEEEIGLARRLARPIGYLDPYLSSTGYLVLPVVALVEPRFTLNLNPSEVADAFEVPLAFLMDPANHELHAREWKGRIRQYYAIPFRERYIWGVTAGILRNLYVRLYES